MKCNLLINVTILLFLISTSVAQVPMDGLIAHYPFNGNANDAVAANHGVVSGAILANDRFNNSLSSYFFDGIDDNITVSVPGNTTISNWTISFWANWNHDGDLNDMPLGNLSDEGSSKGFVYFYNDDVLLRFDGDTDFYDFNNNSIQVNSWALYTITSNGSQVNIYVNDALTGTASKSYNLFDDYTFGYGGYSPTNYSFKGYIDDVRIYNRPITINEIGLIYSEGQSSTCNNGIQDGDETGIDCGGSCPACPPSGSSVWTQDGSVIYYNTGNVGINTSAPDARLTVNGQVHATEFRADLTVPGPDYVFAPEYPLISLDSMQNYLNIHQHLPGIPPAAVMEKEGVELLKMNMNLLQKVEEMMLYILQLNQKIDKLSGGSK